MKALSNKNLIPKFSFRALQIKKNLCMKLWGNYSTKMLVSSGPQCYTKENNRKSQRRSDLQPNCYYFLFDCY